MKNKYLFLLAAIFLLVACKKNKNKIIEEFTPPASTLLEEEVVLITSPINIQDSLKIQKDLGPVIEHQYEGLLPAADGPGIQYDLTLWVQENSQDGVFNLSTTYKGNGNHPDKTFVTEGRTKILHRKHKNKEEVIHELIPVDGTSSLYFVEDGENLTMLNQEMEHISSISNLNYTLAKKK